MAYCANNLFWRSAERFPSLSVDHLHFHGVRHTIDQMKEIISVALVEHDKVSEAFVGPYLKLADALHKLAEALFELYPKGAARFELNEQGIKMLFKSDLSPDGDVYTMIDVGWVYANNVVDVVNRSQEQGSAKLSELNQLAHAA